MDESTLKTHTSRFMAGDHQGVLLVCLLVCLTAAWFLHSEPFVAGQLVAAGRHEEARHLHLRTLEVDSQIRGDLEAAHAFFYQSEERGHALRALDLLERIPYYAPPERRASLLRKKADLHFENRNLDAELDCYAKLIQLLPGDIESRRRIARIYAWKQDHTELRRVLQELIALEAWWAAGLLGQLELDQGNLKASAKAYDLYLEHTTDLEVWHERRLPLAFWLGGEPELRALERRFLQEAPADLHREHSLRLAETYLNLNALRPAFELLMTLHEQRDERVVPKLKLVLLWLDKLEGLPLRQLGDAELLGIAARRLASEGFDRLARDPVGEAWGTLLQFAGKPRTTGQDLLDEAERLHRLRIARTYGAERLAAEQELIDLWEGRGRLKEAVQLVRGRASRADADLARLEDLYLQQGDPASAAEVLALRFQQRNLGPSARRRLAELYEQSEQPGAALDALRVDFPAMKANQDWLDLYRRLAEAAEDPGAYEAALLASLEGWRHLCKRSPWGAFEEHDRRWLLVDHHLRQSQLLAAEQKLVEIADSCERHRREALAQAAELAGWREDYDSRARYCEGELELPDASRRAAIWLASHYAWGGDANTPRFDLLEDFARQSQAPEVHRALMDAYLNRKRAPDALRHARRLLEITHDFEVHQELVYLLSEAGKPVRGELLALLEGRDDDAIALRRVEALARGVDDPELALVLRRRLVDLRGRTDDVYWCGRLAYELGDASSAERWLRRALREDPENAPAHVTLSRVLASRRDPRAPRHLQRALRLLELREASVEARELALAALAVRAWHTLDSLVRENTRSDPFWKLIRAELLLERGFPRWACLGEGEEERLRAAEVAALEERTLLREGRLQELVETERARLLAREEPELLDECVASLRRGGDALAARALLRLAQDRSAPDAAAADKLPTRILAARDPSWEELLSALRSPVRDELTRVTFSRDRQRSLLEIARSNSHQLAGATRFREVADERFGEVRLGGWCSLDEAYALRLDFRFLNVRGELLRVEGRKTAETLGSAMAGLRWRRRSLELEADLGAWARGPDLRAWTEARAIVLPTESTRISLETSYGEAILTSFDALALGGRYDRISAELIQTLAPLGLDSIEFGARGRVGWAHVRNAPTVRATEGELRARLRILETPLQLSLGYALVVSQLHQRGAPLEIALPIVNSRRHVLSLSTLLRITHSWTLAASLYALEDRRRSLSLLAGDSYGYELTLEGSLGDGFELRVRHAFDRETYAGSPGSAVEFELGLSWSF